jgi:hypothetical protein
MEKPVGCCKVTRPPTPATTPNKNAAITLMLVLEPYANPRPISRNLIPPDPPQAKLPHSLALRRRCADSFNDFVGEGEHARRHREPERLRSLYVDH